MTRKLKPYQCHSSLLEEERDMDIILAAHNMKEAADVYRAYFKLGDSSKVIVSRTDSVPGPGGARYKIVLLDECGAD